jgi:hypothetical protein
MQKYGHFYHISDLACLPWADGIYAQADYRRKNLTDQVSQITADANLLFRRTTRQSLKNKGDSQITRPRFDLCNYPAMYSAVNGLEARLDHELRQEVECPIPTQNLTKDAFHLYLEIMQEEAMAAGGQAFAFTLTEGYADRTNILQKISRAGYRVYWVIGCKDRRGKARKKPRTVAQSRSLRNQKETLPKEDVNKFFLHLHGLAIKTELVQGDAQEKLRKLVRPKDFVSRIGPPRIMTALKSRGGRTASLARGFTAYAIYMAGNYDECCPVKNLRRRHTSLHAQRLTVEEKSRLHPKLTKGQLEAWHRAKDEIRKKYDIPAKCHNGWILRHWKEIRETAREPVYDYPIRVILRDGYEYNLSPQWGWEFAMGEDRSTACGYRRHLSWEEIDADHFRLGLPLGSDPVYTEQGGECELDILLHLVRNRRVIVANTSPQCPFHSYRPIGGGKVRPPACDILPRSAA